MSKILFCCGILGFLSCSQPALQNHHWSEWEPYVVATSPEAGYALSAASSVRLEFSQPLLAETLTTESIFIIAKTDFENRSDDWQDMADAVADADIASLPLTFTLDDSQKILSIVADLSSVTTAGDYVLVITPLVLSDQYVPVNQAHVSGTERYFMVTYNLTSEQISADADVVVLGSSVSTSVAVDSIDSANAESEQTISVAQTTDDEGAMGSFDEIDGFDTEPTALAFVIDSVIISEIVTDPQQDFNDSAGGDSVVFDAVVGSGTVGSTDEYIELYNGSAETVNLTGYQLEMTDGTDVQQVISEETWPDVYFSGESDLTAWHPGDYAVLGNPDGAINNTLSVNLWDAEGVLLESLTIEDANADDIYNESYSLDFETGYWEQTLATPGF